MTEDATVELLTPERWVEHGNSTSVKKRRRLVQKYWVTANGFPSVTEGIKAVQNGGLYGSIDTAMGAMEKKGMTPASLHQFRNVYKGFIKSCIGKLDEDRFEAIVKKQENSTTTEKYTPTIEEVKEILVRANTRGKALVSMLADTGMRINEALSRKRSDIEFEYHPFPEVVVPARIRIEAQSTKKKYTRYCYLSHEAVKLLRDFWKEARQSDWVFPSEWAKNRDTHLLDSNLRKEFKALFDKLGLTPQQEDVIFSPHSFRSFCLGVMRRAGFSDIQGQIIVGHKTLETKSYKGNERDIAKDWAEKVEPRLNFLSNEVVVVKSDPKQEKRNRELEEQNTKIQDQNRKVQDQNKTILEFLGHLLTPEQRKKLNLKLPYYSDAQIEKILEEQDDDHGILPDQKALPDESESQKVGGSQ